MKTIIALALVRYDSWIPIYHLISNMSNARSCDNSGSRFITKGLAVFFSEKIKHLTQ